MADIVVFAEQREGKIKHVALEALGAARQLARTSGKVIAVWVGDQGASLAGQLSAADCIYVVDEARFHFYSSRRYAEILAEIAEQHSATAILMGATAMGRDLGPTLAARLSAPFFGDCIEVSLDDENLLTVKRPMYAGKVIASVKSRMPRYQVATLRPNRFPAIDTGRGRVEAYTPKTDLSGVFAIVKEVRAVITSTVELSEAQIVVSGGRGLGAPAHFSLVEDLAQALGAAVGASRAAVDAGWKPHSYQVGLTGKTVSPLLYIACGISGAVQHQAGMSSSKYIVAINTDAHAPIFKIATYGLVGDLFKILPRLTAAITQIKTAF